MVFREEASSRLGDLELVLGTTKQQENQVCILWSYADPDSVSIQIKIPLKSNMFITVSIILT